MECDIVVIGSFFQDHVFYCDAFPTPGQTITGQYKSSFGGKGSNQAIAAQKLSNKQVVFFTGLGRDQTAEAVLAYYAKIGLKCEAALSEQPTGCTGIYVNRDGQNEIVISQGAASDLKLSCVQGALEQSLKTARIIVFQCEMNWEALLELVRFCHDKKLPDAKILLNPAPFRKDYDYLQLMPLIDIIVPNETEMEQLHAAKVAIPERVLLIQTLGEAGTMVNGKQIPTKKVKVVDTTGAGDCWIGGYCAAYVKGMSLDQCCQFANAAASISVTRAGAAASIPSLEEVQEALK